MSTGYSVEVARQRLERTWSTPKALWWRLASTDHKDIGKRYLVTSAVFFLFAGVQSVLMRAQLTAPGLDLLSPEAYNQLFSLHGVVMVFLVSTPVFAAFGNYFVPLMIGNRDMAFPRLNALSYWTYLAAGIFIGSSLLFGAAPNNGWFNYVPLANEEFTPGVNIDVYALGVIFIGISATVGAINFIVTILKLRAPGMAISRMPLFCWSILATALAQVFALPAVTLANIMLELDRLFEFQFFDVSAGGDPLLWQHLFWIFGHPDVYIIVLPALGIVSTILPVFSRRPIVGYVWVATAMMAIAVISFGVWVHHMFVVGLPQVSLAFFGIASILITLPSGIQVFAWLGTMLTGRVRLGVPMLHVIGFLVTFVLGGLTGVMFGAVPFDQQVTDTYFVVAHFHYVLFGGAIFPALAGIVYWLPKLTGRMPSERLGRTAFWLIFTGFHLTFFPMHVVGLQGMPRRIYTYPEGLGWTASNLLASIGTAVLAVGFVVFLVDLLRAIRSGPPAGPDPWGADTLEWATTSPPPPYNFLTFVPITSRNPLWDEEDRRRIEAGEGAPLAEAHHEVLTTTPVQAEPEQVLIMPGGSLLPLWLAVSLLVLCFGLVIRFQALWIGAAVAAAMVILAWWAKGRGP